MATQGNGDSRQFLFQPDTTGKNIEGKEYQTHVWRIRLFELLILIFIVGCTNASNHSEEFINLEPRVINQIDKTEKRNSPLPMTEQKFETKEVLVKFKPGTSTATIEEIAKYYKLEMIKIISPPYLYLYKISGNESVQEVITSLKKMDAIEYSEPNFIYEIM